MPASCPLAFLPDVESIHDVARPAVFDRTVRRRLLGMGAAGTGFFALMVFVWLSDAALVVLLLHDCFIALKLAGGAVTGALGMLLQLVRG